MQTNADTFFTAFSFFALAIKYLCKREGWILRLNEGMEALYA